MCGFAGVVLPAQSQPARERVLAMAHAVAHRGPDHQSAWVADSIGLAHARLSIIDLTASGHQPMISASGRTAIAFNGEIYNYRELRAEFETLGIVFQSHSDTEVLLEGIERFGIALLPRLRGMFAFAAWNLDTQELLLARDPFGIKPVYYASTVDGATVFASEVKALFAFGDVERRIDPQALAEYLWFGNATGDQTMFAGIRKLPPGSFVTIRPGERPTAAIAYWRLEDVQPVTDDEPTATRRIAVLLEDAVRSHMVADVPVGVFLSGGIDSSAITAFASRHATGQLNTFSVGFDFAGGVNELPQAAAVAKQFGTNHHELHLGSSSLPDMLHALVRAHDEPFADAANLPLWMLCRDLRGGTKVVLQGDGGDEVFAGYSRYSVAGRERAWRRAAQLAMPLASLFPKGPRQQRAARFLYAMSTADAGTRSGLLMTIDSPLDSPERLLSDTGRALLAGTNPFATHQAVAHRFSKLDPVQRALYSDLSLLLPAQFLEKVDKATMAHGIEVRVPFLDLALASYGAGLPSSMKVRGSQKKYLLRQALRGIVPDSVLDGPKTGFGVPYGAWLRGVAGDLLVAALAEPAVRRLNLFDETEILRRLEEHRRGNRDYAFMLWKMLQLAMWIAEYQPDA